MVIATERQQFNKHRFCNVNKVDMSEEDTAPCTPTDTLEEFTVVTRKRKGKKNLRLSHSNFNNQLKPTQMDENSPEVRVRDARTVKRKDHDTNVNIIYGVPYVEGVNYEETFASNMNRISLDASLKNPPKYIEPEKEKENPAQHVNPEEESVKVEDPMSPEAVLEQPGKGVEKINTRALPKHAATYQLEKFEKNALLIFNQRHVYGYAPRLGTEKDVAELERTFKNYGFEVKVEDDLTKEEIMAKLIECK